MKLSVIMLGALALVPQVSAAGPISPKMLVEMVSLSGVTLSPDGRWVAYRKEQASIERNGYDARWYVTSIDPGAAPVEVADGGTPLWDDAGNSRPEIPQWSADAQWIYYRALLDGQLQVWRAARDGSGAFPVSRDAADVERFVLDEAGNRLIYTVGASRDEVARAEQDEYDQGILIDGRVNPAQTLFRGALINGRPSTQRLSGFWFDSVPLLGHVPRKYRTIDLSTMQVREASTGEIETIARDGLPEQATFTAQQGEPILGTGSWDRSVDTGRLVVLVRSQDGAEITVRSSTGKGKVLLCRHAPCTSRHVSAVSWRAGHEEVIFVVRDEFRNHTMYAWNVQRDQLRQVVKANGLLHRGSHFGLPACSANGAYAACVAESAGQPPRLERLDLDSGERMVLDAPNLVLSERSSRIEPMRWEDDAGLVFTGQLFLPQEDAADGPVPLFVAYYACEGYLRGGLGNEWPLASLAASGIAALCINQASAGRYGDDGYVVGTYEAALSGIRRAVELLVQRGLVDPQRVGIGGLSHGSEVAMWVARHSDLVRAVSIASGQSSQVYYWLHSMPGRDVHASLRKNWGVGSPTEMPEQWERLTGTSRIRAAVLMQVPEQEYLQNVELLSQLSSAGTPAEMYVFPHEPHIKYQPRHKQAVYVRNLDWFRFWLLGQEDPSALKASQYRRWRAMRDRPSG